MLFHASRSRYIDPGRPPAADGGLRSQYPDLVLGRRQPLDCRQLQQAGRRVLTRSFDTRSKVSIDLVAVAIKPGSSAAYRGAWEHGSPPRSHSGSVSFLALALSLGAYISRRNIISRRTCMVVSPTQRYSMVTEGVACARFLLRLSTSAATRSTRSLRLREEHSLSKAL